MSKRFTDTEKFSDKWYRKLSLLHKVIWEYLLAECNHAGILENFDFEMMSFKIGAEVTKDDLKVFEGRIVFISDDVLFIPKFISFQYGELNPQSKVHASVIKELEKYNINTLSIGLDNSMDSIKDKDIYKDKDKDKDNIVNKEEKKLKNPFESPYIETYQKVYKEVFNKPCYLLNNHRNQLIEIASELGDKFEESLYIVFNRLKFINFEKIGVKPDSAWLLSKDNFIKVLEGTFGTKEQEEEYIYNAYN